MEEALKLLRENRTGFLATVENGKPKIRPFQFIIEDNGRLFFCADNTEEVYKQIKENPYVEYSGVTPKNEWIRISGKVKFSIDLKTKERILASSASVKSIYQTADNPIFEIFYIEHGTITIADFSGNPPKLFEF